MSQNPDSSRSTFSRMKRRHVAFMCVAPLLALCFFLLKPTVPDMAQASPSAPATASTVSVTASARPSQKESFTSLRELMQTGLSEPFGELSVYARAELDPESLEAMNKASSELTNAAEEISMLAKRNFTQQEREFFLGKAADLKRQAGELTQAVRDRSTQKLSLALDAIDNTCQSCHSRLAPHLTQKK